MKQSKPVLALLVAAALFTACSDGERLEASEVPAAVMTSFNSKYTNVTDAHWERKDQKGAAVYEVEFKANDKEIEAVFDANGGVLESKGD